MDSQLEAHLEKYDDDTLPSGAWWAKLEDGVRFWNTLNNLNLDPFGTISEFVQIQSDRSPTIYGFQCPRCFIRANIVSTDIQDAPTCCAGISMNPHEIKDYVVWTSQTHGDPVNRKVS